MLVAVARIIRFSARSAAALERCVAATVWVATAGAGIGAADIIEVSKQRAVTKRKVTGFRINLFIYYGFDDYMPTGVPKCNILLLSNLCRLNPKIPSHPGTVFPKPGICPVAG